MKKGYTIYGTVSVTKMRTLQMMADIVGITKIFIDNNLAKFSYNVADKREGVFILEKIAWSLAGDRNEVNKYIDEIKKENRITFNDVSIILFVSYENQYLNTIDSAT